MKGLVITCFLFLSAISLRAQLWNELFRQKKTQIKYLVKQIAALKLYTSYLEQGYRIVNDGLTFIGDVKQGHFDLDKDYFNSLSVVKPSVKKDKGITEIEMYVNGIRELSVSGKKRLASISILSGTDKETIANTFTNAVTDCNTIIAELSSILTSGVYSMTDNNRITRIALLHDQAESLFHYVKYYSVSVLFYENQVKKEKGSIKEFSQWFEIK
jgi:hypothetical protein